MKDIIPFFKPNFTKEMLDAAMQAFSSEFFLRGPEVESFEREFARYVGSRFAISTNSGTSALLIALQSHNIGKGDLVATTPATFIATGNAILMVGARPLFIDIDPRTQNLDPQKLRSACKEFAIKAILPVHLYGLPADLPSIKEVAEEFNLPVIDDCAQAIGASISKKKIGSLTSVSAFSLYTTKNLSVCGDGGMITTNDPDIAQRCSELRDIGSRSDWNEIGYTARLHSALAAIGRIQLKYLDAWNDKRLKIASIYRSLLEEVSGIQLPTEEQRIFHIFAIRSKLRDKIRHSLRSAQTKVHYSIPLHHHAHIKRHCMIFDLLPEAEKWARETLSLPIYPQLNENEVELICKEIKELIV